MSKGSQFDYRFGNKAHWRRTVWNQIERRVSNKKEAIVLYLAGENNYDKAEMVKRGFCPHNIIAIEKDAVVVEKLRNNKQLCVKGDVGYVLNNWPADKAVSVLFLDTCGTANKKIVISIFDALSSNPAFTETVVLLNFMRGRDKNIIGGNIFWNKESNAEDVLYINTWFLDLVSNGFLLVNPYLKNADDLLKHRGLHVCTLYGCWFTKTKEGMPTFMSYMSTSGQVFDSIVFKFMHDKDAYEYEIEVGEEDIPLSWEDAPTRRGISAVLAHRTMRLQGT